MKKIFLAIAALGSSMMMSAQEVQQVQIGDNMSYGITYSLPQTAVKVKMTVVCRKTEAGQYAQYAEKFLGLTDAKTEDEVSYEITSITMNTKAVADSTRTYHIEFSEKGALPTFYLTDENSLWSINRAPEVVTAEDVAETEADNQDNGKLRLKASDVMNPEILKAGSRIKQAELAAQEIFSIRESRNSLLRGEVDNMPKDGASLQIMLNNLDAQEQALLTLFEGITETTTETREIVYVPTEETNNHVLFRFSKSLGMVDSDDLAGEPYYLNAEVLELSKMDDLTDPKQKKKVEKGIAFCVPGKMTVTLSTLEGAVAELTMNAAQLGHVERLPQAQFTDKKKRVEALFDPTTGAVKMFFL